MHPGDLVQQFTFADTRTMFLGSITVLYISIYDKIYESSLGLTVTDYKLGD